MPTRIVRTLHEGDIIAEIVQWDLADHEWTDFEVHLWSGKKLLVSLTESELSYVKKLIRRSERVIGSEWARLSQEETSYSTLSWLSTK